MTIVLQAERYESYPTAIYYTTSHSTPESRYKLYNYLLTVRAHTTKNGSDKKRGENKGDDQSTHSVPAFSQYTA